MQISLVHGTNRLTLNGSGMEAGLRAARFCDERLTGLELALEGSPDLIAQAISRVGALLWEARRASGQPGECGVQVHITLPDGSVWRSLLRGGSAELAGGVSGRGLRRQGLRVRLEREDWWESEALCYATLSNLHGQSSGAAGLALDNHSDATHDNSLIIDAPQGDLPAPAVWMVTSAAGGLDIFAGLGSWHNPAGAPLNTQAEDGTPRGGASLVRVNDATCSGGAYAACAWSGTGESNPFSVTWSAAQASALAGRVYRPLLRLHSPPAGGEKLWLSLAVYALHGAVLEKLAQTEPALCPSAQMVVLPPLQLPPWPVLEWQSQGFTLGLAVSAETGGAHALNLDLLSLLPADSFLHLQPALSGCPTTQVSYDSASGLLLNNGAAMQSHTPRGDGLWLTPGRLNQLALALRRGSLWETGAGANVNLLYRPRRHTP